MSDHKDFVHLPASRRPRSAGQLGADIEAAIVPRWPSLDVLACDSWLRASE